MKIKIAEYSGFCYGVKRAVEIALESYEIETYTYGPIIHNGEFQKKLERNGVFIETDLEKIENKNLIIRSHGVKKSVYEEAKANNINTIDATCPYVKKIHKIVEEEYNKNRKIIIIGDENHPEVIGINGWCKDSANIIKKVNFILSNLKKSDRISVVCQTTFNLELYDTIKTRLMNKFDDIIFFDTICLATVNRQSSAEKLSKENK